MTHDASALGAIRRSFRPKKANLVAGTILGVALVVGGVAFVVFEVRRDYPRRLDTGDQIARYAILGLIGGGAPLGGLALLLWMKRLAFHRVSVYEHGFSYFYRGLDETCPWTEIEKIDEVFTEEQMKVLKIPGASIKNTDRSFVVHRRDGKQFRFTVNSIDSIPRFAECMEDARVKCGIPWEQIQQ